MSLQQNSKASSNGIAIGKKLSTEVLLNCSRTWSKQW
jgi:hypothetical protein